MRAATLSYPHTHAHALTYHTDTHTCASDSLSYALCSVSDEWIETVGDLTLVRLRYSLVTLHCLPILTFILVDNFVLR